MRREVGQHADRLCVARRVRAAGGPVPHDAPRAPTPAGCASLAAHGLARPHHCWGHAVGDAQVCEPVVDGSASPRGRGQEATQRQRGWQTC
jgi:hypothetical protein